MHSFSLSNFETAEYVAHALGQSARTPQQNSQFLSEIQSASLETHFVGAAAVNLSEDRTQGIQLARGKDWTSRPYEKSSYRIAMLPLAMQLYAAVDPKHLFSTNIWKCEHFGFHFLVSNGSSRELGLHFCTIKTIFQEVLKKRLRETITATAHTKASEHVVGTGKRQFLCLQGNQPQDPNALINMTRGPWVRDES